MGAAPVERNLCPWPRGKDAVTRIVRERRPIVSPVKSDYRIAVRQTAPPHVLLLNILVLQSLAESGPRTAGV